MYNVYSGQDEDVGVFPPGVEGGVDVTDCFKGATDFESTHRTALQKHLRGENHKVFDCN